MNDSTVPVANGGASTTASGTPRVDAYLQANGESDIAGLARQLERELHYYERKLAASELNAERYCALRDVRSAHGPFIWADIGGNTGYTPVGLDDASDRLVALGKASTRSADE